LFETHSSLEIPILEAEAIETVEGAIDLIQNKYSIAQLPLTTTLHEGYDDLYLFISNCFILEKLA